MCPQYIGEDDSSYHFQNPDGSTFQSAKSAVDPSSISQFLTPAPNASSMPDPSANAMPDPSAGQGAMPTPDAPPPGASADWSAPAPDKTATSSEAGKFDADQRANPPKSAQTIPAALDPMSKVKGMEEGYNNQAEGLKNEGDLVHVRGVAESDQLGKANAAIGQQMAKNIKDNQAQEAEVKAQMDKFSKMNDEVQKAAQIDPNRMWNNSSTGAKVTAGISIALGAIGGALTGHGGNAALDVINNAISRDFEAQKMNLQNKQNALTNQGSVVGMYRNQFADKRAADSAALASMYDHAQMQVKQISSRFQGPEAQAKAQALIGQLDVQKNQALMGAYQQVRTTQAMQSLAGGATPTPQQLELLPQEARDRFVPGLGLAGTKEDATKVKDLKPKIDTFLDGLKELQDFSKKNTGKVIDRDAVNRGAALASSLQDQYRQLNGEGVFRKGEAEFIQGVIPSDPTAFFSSSRVLPQLGVAQEMAERSARNFYKSKGFAAKTIDGTPSK